MTFRFDPNTESGRTRLLWVPRKSDCATPITKTAKIYGIFELRTHSQSDELSQFKRVTLKRFDESM
jgi:hypothetical protein